MVYVDGESNNYTRRFSPSQDDPNFVSANSTGEVRFILYNGINHYDCLFLVANEDDYNYDVVADDEKGSGVSSIAEEEDDGNDEEADESVFHELILSILGLDGTVAMKQAEDGILIFRPKGPDRDKVLQLLKAHTEGKVKNEKLKGELLHWVTEDEYVILDSWLPTEKDLEVLDKQFGRRLVLIPLPVRR